MRIIFILHIGFILLLTTKGSSCKAQTIDKQAIITQLKTIFDPELEINIYDLGLIREIKITPDRNVKITMIFTKLFCPYAKSLVNNIKSKVAAVPEVKICKVEVDIHTKWSKSLLTIDGENTFKNKYAW